MLFRVYPIKKDCEVLKVCNQDQPMYKSILIRGLKDLYVASNDDVMKQTIANVLESSFDAMSETCDSGINH
jgi:hypothetical protein